MRGGGRLTPPGPCDLTGSHPSLDLSVLICQMGAGQRGHLCEVLSSSRILCVETDLVIALRVWSFENLNWNMMLP